jgi:hypothetical protein
MSKPISYCSSEEGCANRCYGRGLCNKHYLRIVRKETSNAMTKRYEKTKNGFLVRAYRNMLSRVTGVQYKKAHLYRGLPILPKEEFYEWALSDAVFNELFACWVFLGYPRVATPSVDRIDSAKGYEKGNIRWLTHSENSRLGATARSRAA